MCQKEGSPYYFAPEIFGQDKVSGIRADIWALGVTLYHMQFGKVPFEVEQSDMAELMRMTKTSEPDYSRPCIDPLCIPLIKSLLTKDPKNRPSLQEI